MQRMQDFNSLFSQAKKAPLMITRIKEKPLAIQADFNYKEFSTCFYSLQKNGKQEALFSYFEKMIENLKIIFDAQPYTFLNFILSLDESEHGLLADFGIEWLRQNELFNDLDFLLKLLNRSAVKHWNFFLDSVGHEWLVSRLDYAKFYGLMYHLNDQRSGVEHDSIYLRHYTLLSYLGKESLRKMFTPENLGKYIRNWRSTSTDKAYYVLLNFLDNGNQEVKSSSAEIKWEQHSLLDYEEQKLENPSNNAAISWEEQSRLRELERQQWLAINPDGEKWLQENFSTGHAIGATLKSLSALTAMDVFSLFTECLLKQNSSLYLEESFPKPHKDVLNGWEAFLKYLKPNWQETILTTPGELKALFRGNEEYEPELIYILFTPARQQHLSILQSFELIEALSGKFLHAWLLKNKTAKQVEANIVAQKDKPIYKTYLYAAAKAALYEEEQSANQISWWGIPKGRRVYLADLLVKAISEGKPSEYYYGCNNGSSGLVRKFYIQMFNERVLTHSLEPENNRISARLNCYKF